MVHHYRQDTAPFGEGKERRQAYHGACGDLLCQEGFNVVHVADPLRIVLESSDSQHLQSIAYWYGKLQVVTEVSIVVLREQRCVQARGYRNPCTSVIQ